MRVLATVHLYAYLRAYQRTYGATGAATIIVKAGRQVSGGIQFIGKRNAILGTEFDAYLAAFAKLMVNFDVTFIRGFRIQNKLHKMCVSCVGFRFLCLSLL